MDQMSGPVDAKEWKMDAITQPTNLVDQLIRTAIETVLHDDGIQKAVAEALKPAMHGAITARLGEFAVDADSVEGLEGMIESEVEREVERELERVVSEAVSEAVTKAVEEEVERAVEEAVDEKAKEIEAQIGNLVNERFQDFTERARITID
jgi:uncharacterized membrane protein YheB (UPF0754 family)